MKSPSPPPAPDPSAQIAAQSRANTEAAREQQAANMIDQYTPQGSVEYTQMDPWAGPGGKEYPRYSATVTYSPEQQALYDKSTRFGGLVGDIGIAQAEKLGTHLGTPVDLSPEAVEGRVSERYQPRLDERFAEDEDRLRTQLVNQGFREGTPGYDRALRNLRRSQGDTENQMLIAAYDQAVRDLVTERNQPINETTALMSGAQVTAPQFISAPQVGIPAADAAGAYRDQYAANLNTYNQEQRQRNAMMGGLFGLGSAALTGGWTL